MKIYKRKELRDISQASWQALKIIALIKNLTIGKTIEFLISEYSNDILQNEYNKEKFSIENNSQTKIKLLKNEV